MYYNVNTLGIHFIQGKLMRHHFEAMLDKVMGIPDAEIQGLDVRSDTRFIFKVTTQHRYEQICQRFTGRDIFLERGHIIRVDDISTKGTMVELQKVPFDLTNEKFY